MIAISGNLDSSGGNVILSPGRLAKNSIELFDKLPLEADTKRLGNEFLLSQFEYTKMTHPPSAIKAILEETPYPVKAMFIMAANPVLTSPNSLRVKTALEKLDFLVVADIFMTKTTQLADIVLPACTFLEQTYYATYDAGADLKPTYPGLLMFRPQVVPPLEESRPDWKIIFDLAKKLGYEKYFPWRDIEEAIDYELKPTGITSRDLHDHPEGIMIPGPSFLYEKFGHKKIWGKLLIRFLSSTMFRKYPNMYHKYKRLGFTTPSKKVEILSHRLQEMGYDALPIYHEPSGVPLNDPELSETYPLILTTGGKIRTYVHSQMRNIPSLHQRMPNNVVEVHPETAALFGIDGEDIILVETPQASIKCQARITMNIRPQVVQLYFGFEETNVNLLTSTESFDPITGAVALRSLLCKIRKT
jgi:anaerobic selenocysteine-containing dehydrogenase